MPKIIDCEKIKRLFEENRVNFLKKQSVDYEKDSLLFHDEPERMSST